MPDVAEYSIRIMFSFTDGQTIGMIFTVFGLTFTILGVILFFDAGLILLGNVLFMVGMVFLLGPYKTFTFFSQPKNWKASTCFLAGVVLVIFGYSFFGLIVELFGFIKLFGGFFPYVVMTIRGIPVVGRVLDVPPFKQVADYIMDGQQGLPV
tara:strand:- start:14 stop:469 length:456 start_codon:yes stop_codon:yes gene_type:complete